MAVSHALVQVDGNNVRSTMSKVDLDGNGTMNSGSTLGLTIQTQLAGVDVDASTAELYTSGAALSEKAFMDAAVADLDSKLTGASVRYQHHGGSIYILHVQAVNQLADDVQISVPVVTAAA